MLTSGQPITASQRLIMPNLLTAKKISQLSE